MNKYKVQLHCHTKSDPEDWLFHSEKDLIDKASEFNYDVLSITCHNRLVFSEEIKGYAESKGILLIPGIEKSVKGDHVLIINAKKEAEKIKNFDDLEQYKKEHPECLIIAPHPFHPVPVGLLSLKKNLKKNLYVFDAIEWSSFYTKFFDFNKKATEFAKKHNKTMVGTSDNHALKYLNLTYSVVEADEKTISSILNSIKKGKVEIKTTPMKFFNLFFMTLRLLITEFIGRILRFLLIIKK